jgi:GT2 family glycosyltransferase
MRNDAVDISFVIPVRNDAERLRTCLHSIRHSGHAPDRIEIIVVDNGSSDHSPEVARAEGALVIDAPGRRVSEMRNLGSAAARGRVLAFVDADHLIGPGWIAAALDNIDQNGRVGGAGCLCRAPQPGTWVQRTYDRLRGGRPKGRGTTDWLGAGNMAVSRLAFAEIGGFDVTLETCEDVDLCKRLRIASYVLYSDDRMLNVHLGDPATLGQLFRGELWRGRSNLAVSFRQPIVARELPSAIVPIVHLTGLGVAAVATVAGGVPGAITAVVALTPLALAAAARAARMSAHHGARDVRQVASDTVVAFVYDLARALALVAFAGHSVRRQ